MTALIMTEPELLVLGLVAEMPRHAYELHQEIERRGMREWTSIGFSSVYFLLDKLEKKRLVRSKAPKSVKAKKVFTVTAAGQKTLVAQTRASLGAYRRISSSVLPGMLHWPFLTKEEALCALTARAESVTAEQLRLGEVRAERQPLPDFVEAVFDYALGQLRAEGMWIEQTLDYMKTKPWLE
jgi:DNA-binding PadR family transcriptional regulator